MVLAMLFMLLLSVLGATIVALSRSETISSVNYRLMSQARYAAEAGVHKAAHFVLNSYTVPGTPGDPLSNYDLTLSPVRSGGQPVVLSAMAGLASNYPAEAVKVAFGAAGQGPLVGGDGGSAKYAATATLLSMRQVVEYGAVSPTTIQTWRLTARGWLEGARNAEVEVAATIERRLIPTTTYGMFATNPGCGALTATGGVLTDSYDSNNMVMVSGMPQTDPWGGSVGTNGNMEASGNQTLIQGALSTPRTGIGNCKDGAVTALDQNGQAQVTEGVTKLPQAVTYPPPALPSPLPPTTTVSINGSTTCAGIPVPSANCSITYPYAGAAASVTLDPQGAQLTLGDLRVTSGTTVTLMAGTYALNSVILTGNSTLKIASGPVVLNVVGTDQNTPIDFTGGAISNTTFISDNFRILYAGTDAVKLTGGTTTAASVYAPKAEVSIAGGAHFFGSVVGAEVKLAGGTKFHYDRKLTTLFSSAGPYMMSVFTWKEY
jgi:hypothetical protein